MQNCFEIERENETKESEEKKNKLKMAFLAIFLRYEQQQKINFNSSIYRIRRKRESSRKVYSTRQYGLV